MKQITTINIKSWCQRVLDLLDLSFAESLGLSLNYQIYLDFLITWDVNLDKCFFFFQTRKENSGFYGVFQIFLETQAKLSKPS